MRNLHWQPAFEVAGHDPLLAAYLPHVAAVFAALIGGAMSSFHHP